MIDRLSPIGVFDSGVGGLSVLRELRRQLPAEHLVYVADSAYAPYGERAEELVERRAESVTEFLMREEVKAVVVACNTATSIAIDRLRGRFSMPFVGMEPAVKPASLATASRVIGVLATSHTLSSAKFRRLVNDYCAGITVLPQACPLLVRQVENGELNTDATRAIVEHYLRPLLDRGADRIVLGCSHFAFVSDVLQAVAGPDVPFIDPAEPVARQMAGRLKAMDLLALRDSDGTDEFWTTGDPSRVNATFTQLWRNPLTLQQLFLA